MLFQTLDNKKECYAIFVDDDLYHYSNSLELSETWNYTTHVDSKNIEYAQVWCGGKNLADACPEGIKDEWQKIYSKSKAFMVSLKEAKINLNDNCFYDLIPKRHLIEYCRIKNKITKYVLEHYKKPKNYDFMVDVLSLLNDIEATPLNIIPERLNIANIRARNLKFKIDKGCNNIFYNVWGSVTGRLTTKSNSFPILTLNKEFRNILVPNNDWFVELDFNAAELRTLFNLLGKEQPEEDIHSWISENIFNSKYDRDETKKKVFAWLYNPKAKNKKLAVYLDKESALKKYYINGVVNTPFDRSIEVSEDKALNYLIQSTTSDLFLKQVVEINKLLKERKSHVAFCVHDSVIIDFCDEDRDLLIKIMDLFSETKLGNFKVNVRAGRDYGNMGKLKF